MITENNRFLGGHLVGIGKGKANGEIEYYELKKPIHNRITSVGLDHLFQWNGTNTIASTSQAPYPQEILLCGKGGNSTVKYRAGALHFMSFGSGNTATSFTDTDLASGTGIYTETRQTSSVSSQELNGTKLNSFGSYSMRISHKSEPVAETTTVREIGWFGGYGTSTVTITSGTKVLFARVVLPTPFVLNAGEYLITTYQLDITVSNSTVTSGSSFFGLKDSNGNDLQYEQKLTLKCSPDTGGLYNVTDMTFPFITKNGNGACNNYSGAMMHPVFCKTPDFCYSTDPTCTFPSENDYNSDLSEISTDTDNRTILDYTGAGSTNKFRDHIFTLKELEPGLSNDLNGYVDIYYIGYLGMCYRFGYYDNGVWVPQAFRKYANQSVSLTIRTRYSTADTTLS